MADSPPDYYKKRTALRKAEGICLQCGKDPAENGSVHCEICANMNRMRMWEPVYTNGISTETHRLKVPGGWLYKHREQGTFRIVFVPEKE